MRVISLNMQGAWRRGLRQMPELIASHEPDVALLQECRPGWVEKIGGVAGMEGVFYYEAEPSLPVRSRDGCAIAVRSPMRIERAWADPTG